jgi:hypothetical protein
MAKIQTKFLDQAMEARDKMNANMKSMDAGSGENSQGRGAFLSAQGDFQANMQMFNTFMAMSNNMLKTLGQALNSMSSKQ